MSSVRLLVSLIPICCLVGCGTMAKPANPAASDSSLSEALGRGIAGRWSLEYTGGCTGRESETIHLTLLDDETIVFDDFELRRNNDGVFQGRADFIAPMPADGRDVVYTIAFSLSIAEDGGFAGTESITEGGGQSLECPVKLVPGGE